MSESRHDLTKPYGLILTAPRDQDSTEREVTWADVCAIWGNKKTAPTDRLSMQSAAPLHRENG